MNRTVLSLVTMVVLTSTVAVAGGNPKKVVAVRTPVAPTIDATINPDFGQVEADPAVLNLTTNETLYREKRLFFIEGAQILRFTTFGDDFDPGLFLPAARRPGASY